MLTDKIDTLETAYDKIASGNWGSIRTYHSDVYYITYLVNYKFGTSYEPKEIHQMLYDEGLLKWSDYGIPRKYIRMLSGIRFKHVPATRPDYNQ